MKETIPLKEIARIGNDVITLLVGVAPNHKIEMDTEERDYTKCPLTCALHSFPVERKASICENHCPHNVPRIKRAVYVNERHQYHISKELADKKFSKSAIKLYILCHFLHIDINGFIQNVSLTMLAKQLGVTKRTIKNLIALFEEYGVMTTAKISSEFINILLPNYQKNHLSKQEGGNGGYLKMDKKALLEFVLEADNVNALREGLRFYKKAQSDKYMRKLPQSQWTKNDIKRTLPTYLHYENGIKQTIEGTQKMFDVTYNGHFAMVTLKEHYDARLTEVQLKEQAMEELFMFVKVNHIKVKDFEKQMADLLQMSLEYGLSFVLEALERYKTNKALQLDEIENIGGKIRTTIRMLLNEKISA